MSNLMTNEALGYYLVESAKDTDMPYQLPDEGLQEKINGLYFRLTEKELDQAVVEEVETLKSQYPDVPQVYNFLSSVYHQRGEIKKAFACNETLINQFPDYLYGRINKAQEALSNEDYAQVPELLGADLDLQSLFPDRRYFHIDEFLKFTGVVISYFVKTGLVEEARNRLAIMQEVAPDSEITLEAMANLAPTNFASFVERMQREEEQSLRVKSYPKRIEKPDAGPPNFHHREIQEMYEEGEKGVSREKLGAVSSLPRETAIEDLEAVIRDSLWRFDHHQTKGSWKNTLPFTYLAIHLLGDLEAYDSLPLIFDFLRQEEAFHDFWMLLEDRDRLWQPLYLLGNQQLGVLKDFILEKDNYEFPRHLISSTVAQIALHQPERRSEVLEWYQAVFQYFIDHRNEAGLIDSRLLAFMAWDLIDMNASELQADLKTLYTYFFISDAIAGDREKVLSDLVNRDKREPAPLQSTAEWFTDLTRTVANEWGDRTQPGAELQGPQPPLNLEKPKPYIREQAKIGRNDPCPCGSGKKYKKCCMKQ
jgi:hypothetical protein